MVYPVLDLEQIKGSKEFSPSLKVPFLDMIFDKNKKQAIYENYDKNYKESKEEEEIFKLMTARLQKRGK